MAAKDNRQSRGAARRVPGLKPGKYTDGLRLDELEYLECKLIRKPATADPVPGRVPGR